VISIVFGFFGTPCTVDRFACTYNAKLLRFNSRFYQICTEAVDAFTQKWGFNNNWLFPPTVLIPRVIRHLRACWQTDLCYFLYGICGAQCFGPCFVNPNPIHWNNWIHEWKVLSNERNLIIKGNVKNCIFTNLLSVSR
jgi:hypothetical protein